MYRSETNNFSILLKNLSDFPKLNLPPAHLHVRQSDDGVMRVYCPLRRRFVALTPEEWVRQHFVHYLTENLGYPGPLLANEVSITLNSTSRRCDTVLYSPQWLKPIMIIEYKAPHINITQEVFDQIVRYNMVLQVPVLIVSNGLSHYCCTIDYAARAVRFLPSIPPYVGAEHIFNFVLVEALHLVTGRTEIFTGVKFARLIGEDLADSCCHGKTAV